MTSRLKKLTVNEVSVVTRPASRRDFAVTKQDEDPEAAMDSQEQGKQPDSKEVEKKDGDGAPAAVAEKGEAKPVAAAGDPPGQSAKSQQADPVEKKEKDDPEMVTISKSELDGLKTAAGQMKELSETVTKLRDDSDRTELRHHIQKNGWSGKVEQNVNLAMTMKKSLPEETFKSWIESQDSQAALIRKSALFNEVGANGEPDEGDAEAVVMKSIEEAKSTVQKSAENPNAEYDAIVKAIESNPSYNEARRDHLLRGKFAGLDQVLPHMLAN